MVDQEFNPKIILGIAAHPDDLEFTSGGMISKFIQKGAKVYYLVLTDGSKGFIDHKFPTIKLIQLRQKEQLEAASILGVADVTFLDHIDGELENSLEVRKQIVKIIRQIKPDTVVTFDPSFVYDEHNGMVNHPDHRAIGQATLDAAYPFARNSRTFPELIDDENLDCHSVRDILLVNFSKANFFVDIKNQIDKKLLSIKAHGSQFDDFDAISKRVIERAGEYGKRGGFALAEGFVRITLSS